MTAGEPASTTGCQPKGGARFLVGIDLGTSNCAMAFVDLERGREAAAAGADAVERQVRAQAEVQDFPIPQVQEPGEVGAGLTLPSCAYLPAAGEFPAGSLDLPWGTVEGVGSGMVVGEFARRQGARVPGRQVVSAKSWLCHPGVDRSAAILPWGATPDVVRVSPVEASAAYLAHLVRAWDAVHPGYPLGAQEVVITVPASFDAVARALTVEAARRAGLEGCTLVEEPQAAFQAFSFEAVRRGELETTLAGVRLVLVIDVGGGTTDFTLVRVGASEAGPTFERLAVGDHLMLGGDNMDAALARCAEERMASGGRRLAATAWSQLVQAAREAKEALLAGEGPAEFRVAVAGQGRALMGGTFSANLTRDDVERVVVEGFFPGTGAGDRPARGTRLALQELGLPYAREVAIPRQLAGFLHAHREAGWAALGAGQEGGDGLPRPDAILVNGGVFWADRLVRRLVEVVSGWWPGSPGIRCLRPASLDLAVARGAACHALARRGLARRMTGGSSHALYVGLERSAGGEASGLCVIPRGHEEGTTVELAGRVFRLMLGRPVQFPLFTSTADRVERAGDIVPVSEAWTPLPPLHALLKSGRGATGAVPVHLRATLTEIGTLELWCVAEEGDDVWRLEFELRGGDGAEGPAGRSGEGGGDAVVGVVEPMPSRFPEARQAVEEVFAPRLAAGRTGGSSAGELQPTAGGKGAAKALAQVSAQAQAQALAQSVKAAKQLGIALERCLGPREGWRTPVLRELWGAFWAGAARRRRTAEHERAFYQLAGYTLRPGFGYPLDDWRCEQMATLFREGVQFGQERAVWGEYWVAWRRIAGGLSPERQAEIWGWMKPHLAHRIAPGHPRHLGRPKGVQPEGTHEMVRLAAALEHLPVAEKVELGGWILAPLADAAAAGGPWGWALGRLGARMPLHGSRHRTVPAETAAVWAEGLMAAAGRGVDGTLFALAQVARRTGDRSVELDEGSRERVLGVLRAGGASEAWVRMVEEVVVLERADAARALGDTLPVGLRL